MLQIELKCNAGIGESPHILILCFGNMQFYEFWLFSLLLNNGGGISETGFR